jgi:hypothetical protein
MAILAGQRIRALDFAGDAYDYETANDTTASTSFTNGTLHGVAFTAPTSGSVWITFGGAIGNNAATALTILSYMSFYVRTGSSIGAGTDVLVPDNERAIRMSKLSATAGHIYDEASFSYKLTGLTAGSSYNVITQFKAVSGTASCDDRWIRVSPAFS